MGLKQRLKSAAVLGAGIGLVATTGLFVGGAAAAHADPVQVTGDWVNVRSAPGLDAEVVGSFGGGQRVDSLGPEENGWVPVRFMGDTAYVSAEYLKPVGEGGDDGGDDGGGEETGEAGTAWATVRLNVRSGPGTNHPSVGMLNAGDQVETTGKTANGFSEINHDGGTAWAATQYLSTEEPAPTPPPGGGGGDPITLPGVVPSINQIVAESQNRFPQIETYGGVRAGGGDHGAGKAVDIMIPNYRSNSALGWEIAEYFKANAAQYDIKYIIWEQQIWSVQRSSEGWRPMEDRGSDTQNHYDHVHISVN